MSQSTITPDDVAQLQRAADDAATELRAAQSAAARREADRKAAERARVVSHVREHLGGKAGAHRRDKAVAAAQQAVIDAALEFDGAKMMTRWLEYVAACGTAHEQALVAEAYLADDRGQPTRGDLTLGEYNPKSLRDLLEQAQHQVKRRAVDAVRPAIAAELGLA